MTKIQLYDFADSTTLESKKSEKRICYKIQSRREADTATRRVRYPARS